MEHVVVPVEVPEANNGYPLEAWQIFDTFPDEMLQIVFEHLESSSIDLLNCTRVCKKWERISKENECAWLFDQVLPFIFPYLDKWAILTSRQVAKQWQRSIDKFVESHESRQPFDEKTSDIGHPTLYSVLNKRGIKWNHFYSKDLTPFMKLMGNCKANPFFGRSLWLEFQEEPEDEDELHADNSQFWPTVFKLLSSYGSHVWYFTIGTYGTKNTYRRFLFLLNNCLSRLPNLKSLHIFGWINESPGDEEDEGNHLSVQNLSGYLESHPLPVLPFLETLEISNMNGIQASIQDHIITRHSTQLKCLQLSEWDQSRLMTDIKLPSLKELLIDVSRFQPMEKSQNLLSHLSTSPIGKMSISFNSLETTLNMPQLFDLISNFKETLCSLRLTVIPGAAREKNTKQAEFHSWTEEASRSQLIAPKLRALHLEGFNRLPLTFLGRLASSLEYLEIRPLSASIRKQCYPTEGIDLYQYLESCQVYDSQVWMDLPKIKKIYFEACRSNDRRFRQVCFSRAYYEFWERLKRAPSPSIDNFNS